MMGPSSICRCYSSSADVTVASGSSPSRIVSSLTLFPLCNPWLQTWAAVLSCNVLCRLGFNTRSQCRAEGAPLSAEGAPSMAMSAEGANARRSTRRWRTTRTDICTVRGKHEIYGDERIRSTNNKSKGPEAQLPPMLTFAIEINF